MRRGRTTRRKNRNEIAASDPMSIGFAENHLHMHGKIAATEPFLI